MTLDEWMQKAGKSRADVAKEIGVSVISVGRYITGHRVPRPRIARRIKEFTAGDVTANDFECRG